MNQQEALEYTYRTETAKLNTEMLRFYLERAQPAIEFREVTLPSGEKQLEPVRLFYQYKGKLPLEVAEILQKIEVKFDNPKSVKWPIGDGGLTRKELAP